ncbi:MAG: acyl-CoA dehydrogenase [Rhizobiaceae bacterium]|nr:acyl-CoA dehydrogenase [Rhizobiaceae bacterium]
MHLVASPEQQMIRDSGAKLFGRCERPRVGTAAAFDAALWGELAANGWLAFLADPGAAGADVALFLLEAGRAGVSIPLIDCALAPGRALRLAGRADAAERLVRGEGRVALAAEPVAGRNAPVASRSGSAWALDGECIAPAGGWCDAFLVAVELDGRGPDFALIPQDRPGLTAMRYAGMDGCQHARLRFEAASAPSGTLLGLSADGVGAVLAAMRAAACAEAAGHMAALLAATRRHVLARKQFGKPIASFQAVEHRIARMVIAVEEARSLALFAAIRLAADATERDRAISGAKAKIGALSRFVAQNAVQLHGGMGVSEDMPVGHHFRRLATFEARHGTTRHHRDQVAAFVRGAPSLGGSLLDAGAGAA